MRLIDADELDKVKFHPLPYTHITPSDADAESYKRGWNDAIDAVMSEAPTVEERKTVSDEEWTKLRGGWINQPDRELVEQIRWERDVAIDQLKELGYGFGEKPRRDADCISRQAAIDAILYNQEVYSNNFGGDPIDRYTIAIIDNDAQTIANMPSAQLERKTGKWIKHENSGCWHCSECGIDNYYAYVWNCDTGLYEFQDSFCPNCGADMRETP